MLKTLRTAALLGAFSLAPHAAFAWNDDGHRIVALVADHFVLPATREKINALLKSDPDALTARDIASAATWADKYVESDSSPAHNRDAQTRAWHYVEIHGARPNIPEACFGQKRLPKGVLASQGPAQACAIDKINQFAAELREPSTAPAERVLALKFLLNLIADIHQPLRVIDEGNHHGTGVLTTAPDITPGDLFTFWDSVVITRIENGEAPDVAARELVSRISAADAQAWASRAPQLWALESFQLGLDDAYGMVRAYDDHGRAALQEPEVARAVQITATQLSRAGVRLAFVLNEAFAPAAISMPATGVAKAGDSVAGRQFTAAACAQCHAVLPGQSPTAGAPDFQAIANTDGISVPALQEFLFGRHPSMPNIKLSQRQAADITAYIMSLKNHP